MKAAYIRQPGPPESLTVGEIPDPEIQPGHVLVRNRFASVNPIDCYLRSGLVKQTLPDPFIPGCDLAGVVEQVGVGVSGFQPGDRVWATNLGLVGRQGTLSELSLVDPLWLHPSPHNVADRDLAACGLVGVTAHLGLVQRAAARAGQTLLVIGGSGGVGSMVIQIAKILGLEVAATAGSPEKEELCLSLGADWTVNYRQPNWAVALRQQVPAFDIIWDATREPDLATSIDLLGENGQLILMAGREARPPLPVGPFYVKQLSMHGVIIFKNSPEAIRRAMGDLSNWLAAGQLRSNIAVELPLDRAAEAHALQEGNTLALSGRLSGKIAIAI